VAAPTAGLHFTEDVLNNLSGKGIDKVYVTLHVGAGTFQPVRSRNISGHTMHTEHFFVTNDTISKLIENKGRIIAVGTTSVRTIESIYWLGVRIIEDPEINIENLKVGQWEPYERNREISSDIALEALSDAMKRRGCKTISASTQIIIIPGYRFRITNGIITNFHQPGSTLLLLIAAWTGNAWKDIYNYALDNGFRFLSYGDSSFLFRNRNKC
jgi:S-adenosylmethionine:tRNA ribosyltransferase-isomerase